MQEVEGMNFSHVGLVSFDVAGETGPAFVAAEAGGWQGWLGMDIAEGEHFGDALFSARGESAAAWRRCGIAQGSEHPVPEREVGIVLAVVFELVMHAVAFWALDEPTDPSRCTDVPMIEILGDGGDAGVDRRAFDC